MDERPRGIGDGLREVGGNARGDELRAQRRTLDHEVRRRELHVLERSGQVLLQHRETADVRDDLALDVGGQVLLDLVRHPLLGVSARGEVGHHEQHDDDDEQGCRSRAAGAANGSGGGGPPRVREAPASCCRSSGHRLSHPVGRRDAQQPESVADDLAGRVVQPEAGAVQVGHRLVAVRQRRGSSRPHRVPARGTGRRAPRCSARRGAARAARRPGRRCAGTPARPPEQRGLGLVRRAARARTRCGRRPPSRRCAATLRVRACAYCT